jgi:ABC-type branched-subunit amino acid transport system substrate-binding protein
MVGSVVPRPIAAAPDAPGGTMRRIRWATIGLVVALLGTVTVGTAPGSAATDKPTATEVGVTPTEIHVAVVADVDNSIAPNLFAGSRDAVLGYARYVNKTGGIAGRKLVVDFYDSKLNPNETRNAEIQACQNDLAMVGTSSVFLVGVDDMRACKDKTGTATGLPDVPFVTTARVQACSDQSFPVTGSLVVCSTQEDHPQTYVAPVGRGLYWQKKYGKDLHGVYVFGSDTKSARDSAYATLGQLRAIGIESDGDFDRSASAQQSEYTAIVQTIRSKGSNYAQCTGQYTCTVLLRKEATLQGVQSVKVWDCGGQCYDPKFLSTGGTDVDGQYIYLNYLPFLDKKEQKANKMLANFVKYTGADKVDGFGAYAWPAAEAFREAVDTVVQKDGVNGITRQSLLDALNGMHEFDAGGMFGKTDLADRKVTDCFVLLQVQHGKFVRVYPKKAGTMSCTPKNLLDVKLDIS